MNNVPLLPENVWLDHAKRTVSARINAILKDYPRLAAVYVMFSGGDDSTTLAWLASHHPMFKGVVFANTLTGDKETVTYVRETAQTQGWAYHETKPNMNERFPGLLATRGVMGPAMHPMVFGYLKGKPWDRKRTELAKLNGCRREDILFLTGVRREESEKRKREVNLIKEYRYKNGKLKSVWGSPLYDWTRGDLECFFDAGKIERNPHAYAFGASRECGCKTAEGAQDLIIEMAKFPIYYQRRQLQYELARAAYRLQQFELEHDLIEPEDASIPDYAVPDEEGAFQPMLFDYRYEAPDSVGSTPFVCIGCENPTGKIDRKTFDRVMEGLE